jgi:hypothetical protein
MLVCPTDHITASLGTFPLTVRSATLAVITICCESGSTHLKSIQYLQEVLEIISFDSQTRIVSSKPVLLCASKFSLNSSEPTELNWVQLSDKKCPSIKRYIRLEICCLKTGREKSDNYDTNLSLVSKPMPTIQQTTKTLRMGTYVKRELNSFTKRKHLCTRSVWLVCENSVLWNINGV